MHVAVLGAGALGRVFGVRLAAMGKVGVDLVVRPSAAADGAIWIEQVGGEALSWERPSRVTAVPAHADVVLVCVRGDQLGEELLSVLRSGPAVPVVVLTPMLPTTNARVAAALEGRAVPAMSSVTGYMKESGVTRYWISRSASTLLEEPRAPDRAIAALIEALETSGIPARLEAGLHEANAATVIAMLPLFLGIDAAGSFDALLDDPALSKQTFAALAESRALAERCGPIAPWARGLFRFLGPITARIGIGLARRRSPEGLSFVEGHFGRRGRGQNVAMGQEVVALASEKGTPHESLEALLARLA